MENMDVIKLDAPRLFFFNDRKHLPMPGVMHVAAVSDPHTGSAAITHVVEAVGGKLTVQAFH